MFGMLCSAIQRTLFSLVNCWLFLYVLKLQRMCSCWLIKIWLGGRQFFKNNFHYKSGRVLFPKYLRVMVFNWDKIFQYYTCTLFPRIFIFLRKVAIQMFNLKVFSLLKPGQNEVQYFYIIKLHFCKSHHC